MLLLLSSFLTYCNFRERGENDDDKYASFSSSSFLPPSPPYSSLPPTLRFPPIPFSFYSSSSFSTLSHYYLFIHHTPHLDIFILLFLLLLSPSTLRPLVSSQSSHHPQEVLLAQFSLYVHKGGLKPDSFHFFVLFMLFICLYT